MYTPCKLHIILFKKGKHTCRQKTHQNASWRSWTLRVSLIPGCPPDHTPFACNMHWGLLSSRWQRQRKVCIAMQELELDCCIWELRCAALCSFSRRPADFMLLVLSDMSPTRFCRIFLFSFSESSSLFRTKNSWILSRVRSRIVRAVSWATALKPRDNVCLFSRVTWRPTYFCCFLVVPSACRSECCVDIASATCILARLWLWSANRRFVILPGSWWSSNVTPKKCFETFWPWPPCLPFGRKLNCYITSYSNSLIAACIQPFYVKLKPN